MTPSARPWLEALEARLAPATVSWINLNGGDWDTASNWSSNAVPGAGDDVTIGALNAGASVSHSQTTKDSVNSISAAAPITLSAGTLNVAGDFSDSSTVTLSGGTLANATVQPGTALKTSFQTISTLQNVTLAGSLSLPAGGGGTFSAIEVTGSGLTLQGGSITLNVADTLAFNGSQTLGGSGTVTLIQLGSITDTGAGNTLTIGPNITVVGDDGGTIDAGSAALDNQGTISDTLFDHNGVSLTINGTNWVNDGTIQAITGGSVTLSGSWTNDAPNPSPPPTTNPQILANGGTVNLTGTWVNDNIIALSNSGTLNLGGTFTLATLGTLNRTPLTTGTVNVTGTLNLTGQTLGSSSGTWTLAGGTIQGGTVTDTLQTASQTTSTLQNVTLADTLSMAGGSAIKVAGTQLTLQGATLLLNGFDNLAFSGSQSLNGSGSITLSDVDSITDSGAGNTLTIASGIAIQGGNSSSINTGTASFDNEGTLTGQGQNLSDPFTITGSNWVNDGIIQSLTSGTGSTVVLAGTWTNNADGQILANGGTVNLTGSWVNDNIIALSNSGTLDLGGTFTLATLGTLNRTPLTTGTVNVTGTLNLTGQTLGSSSGTWTLAGGTIQGGTVTDTLQTAGQTTSTLQNVTLADTLSMAAGSAIKVAGTQLTLQGATLLLNGFDNLAFSGSQSLNGSGSITLSDVDSITDSGAGNTLTIASGIAIQGGNSSSINTGTASFDNEGTLTGQGQNLSDPFTITGSNWVNDGTIQSLTSGTGSTVVLAGTWTNNADGQILANGGTVSLTGTWINASTNPIPVSNGGTLTISGTWSNSTPINASKGTVNLSGTWSNSGPITIASTSTLSLSGTWTNTGSISETSSTVNLGGTYKTSGIGPLSGSGGIINFTGTLTNDGTLTLDGSGISPQYTLAGATISGGTIRMPNGGELFASTSGGTLDGVSMSGTVVIGQTQGMSINVKDNLTLNGTIILEGTGALNFVGTQTLSGSGSVDFAANDTNPNKGLFIPTAGTVLTIGSGILIHGDTGSVGESSGGTLTNNGTIASDGGGTIAVQSYTNFAGGTLTGGAWQVSGSSILRVVGAAITTNAASILLDGASARLYSAFTSTNALAGFASNTATGSFTIQNGATFTASGAFANAGSITVGSGSTFTTAAAGYTQPGGATYLNGGTLGASGASVNINGGNLSGPGTIKGNLTNAGEVDLGSAAGTLTINGNYTQTAAGILSLKVGGTKAGSQFDQVSIGGQASLNGTLDATLLNGFGPSVPQTFAVLAATGASGNFAKTNMPTIDGQTAFSVQTTTTGVNLVALINSSDLSVASGSIVVPGGQGTTGQNITVNYTVQNLSPSAASGSWTDSVYLSANGTVNSNDFLLGRVTHTGGLAGMSSYGGTLTAPVPGVVDGNYSIVVVSDSQLVVPDLNRANNTGVSAPLPVATQALALGAPVSGTIAAGQDVYYELDLTSNADVQITGAYQTAGEANLLVRHDAIPTSSSFDEAATDSTSASAALRLAQPQGGAYYILVQGQPGAASGQSFTLAANVIPFEINSVSPSQGSNSGQATITVTGAEFTAQTVFQVQGPGGVRTASSVQFQDDSTVYATFDLTGLSTGLYDVLATNDGNQTVTKSTSFQVVSGDPGRLQTSLSTAAFIRPNQQDTTVTISYANVGVTDIPAPLLTVQATNAVLGYADEIGFVGDTLPVLAIDQNGPAGVLPPGYHGTITLDYQPTTETAHTQVKFNLLLPPAANTPIDWDDFKAGVQPSYIGSDAWDAIWSNFTTAAGATAGQYEAYLDSLATYFSAIGSTTSDVDELDNFAIYLASDALPVTAPITSVDDSVPVPGLSLTFERTFQQTLSGQYQTGALGRGWTDNWQISATTDAQGNVTIDNNGEVFSFIREANGSYISPASDYDVLTLTAGVYQLLETNGSVIAFHSDGTLDYEQDVDGNRITAGYSSGQLTSLTDSNGGSIGLAYNSQGLISQVSDSNGQVTSYSYDTNGQELLTASSSEGTVVYTYTTGGNPAQQYALASITNTDGTHVYFTYDAQGRLINQQGCLCPSNPVTHLIYTYGTGGTVTTTDNSGDSTVDLYNQFGEAAVVQNALGQITRSSYDANGNLLREVFANGTAETYTYDASGNILGETDPLGNTTTYTYDDSHNLTSYTDADGNTTSYGYNASSDLMSVTYASGAHEQYAYNPLGEAASFLDANGDAIGYTYYANGLLETETFADNTSYSYTYDKYANLTSATDALGNVTRFVYGSASDGDPSDPYLLAEVDYPDGTWLKFTYNTYAQRVQSVDQTGFTVNYSYDDAGRLTTLTDGTLPVGNLIVQYTHDVDGRLSQEDNGNGTRTVYAYNAGGELLSIVNLAPDHVTVNSFDDYTFDPVGNVLTDTNQDGEWTYSYDADNRLSRAVFTPNSTDPDGLASEDLQYMYDPAGDRIAQTANSTTTSYTVNNLNQYTSSTTVGQGTTTYQYDLDGNLVAMTAPGNVTTNYQYNPLGQLTGVNGPDLSASYFYDALNNLVSQTVNGSTTNYQIDPAGPLGSVVAAYRGTAPYKNSTNGLLAHYTYGTGLTSQVSASNVSSYYDFSLTGNTTDVTNAAGTVVNRYSYLPFGETTTVMAALPNPFTYVGRSGVMTEADGSDFMRARFYSPTQGRFLARDPLGLAGGNPVVYVYVSGNPVNEIDPGGEDAFEDLFNCRLEEAELTCGVAGSDSGPDGELAAVSAKCAGLQATYILSFRSALNPNVQQHLDDVKKAVKEAAKGKCKPPSKAPARSSRPLGLGQSEGGGGSAGAAIETPADPNDIVGPAGYGPDGFLLPSQTMPFRIDFENEALATAPAQVVLVTQQLDANLDWSTFQLGDFNISGQDFAVPAGLTSYSTRIDLTSTAGVYVDVSAQFNETTGVLTWTFTSLDPTTLDVPAGNPEEGFLPPDVTPPQGDAWLSYSIEPKATDTTGTVINAQATVYFNAGLSDQSSLSTASIFNTIDAGAPTSSVSALPAFSPEKFVVSWSGQDDTGGSGIAYYNVYVSDDAGPFMLWQSASAQTSATFTGQDGHTYSFYSIATDNLGNVQPTPASAQASTQVQTGTTVALQSDHLSGSTYGQNVTFTATLTANDPSFGTPTGSVQFQIDGVNVGSPVTLNNGVASFSTATLTAGSYTITALYSSDSAAFVNSQQSITFSVSPAMSVQSTQTVKALQTIATGSTLLATFGVQAGLPLVPSDFVVTIDWKDGSALDSSTNSPSDIAFTVSGNQVRVSASHTYGTGGSYVPAVTLSYLASATIAANPAIHVGSDVSTSVSMTKTAPTYYSGATNTALGYYHGDYRSTLTIKNTSSAAINGSFEIVLSGLAANSPNALLQYATVTVNGTLYNLSITLDSAGDPVVYVPQSILSSLAAGSSLAVSLWYYESAATFISYTPRLFSDPFDN